MSLCSPAFWHPSARGGVSFILWVVMLLVVTPKSPSWLCLLCHDLEYTAPIRKVSNLSFIELILSTGQWFGVIYELVSKPILLHGPNLSLNYPPDWWKTQTILCTCQPGWFPLHIGKVKDTTAASLLTAAFPETTHCQTASEVLGNTQTSRSSEDQCCWWSVMNHTVFVLIHTACLLVFTVMVSSVYISLHGKTSRHFA